VAVLAVLELVAANALFGFPGWARAEVLSRPSLLASALPSGFSGRVSVDLTGDERLEKLEADPSFLEHTRDALVPLRWFEDGLRAVEGYGAPEPRRAELVRSLAGRAYFDMVGAEFFVRPSSAPYADLTPVAAPEGLPALYRSGRGFPPAYVVQRARVATDEEALAVLRGDDASSLRQEVLLAEGAGMEGSACASEVRWRERRRNSLKLSVEACAPGYLVLTDAFFPGWEATVDGAPAPIVRANYLVRAVRVPAGAHEVRMRYRPRSFQVGSALSLLGLAACIGALLWRGRRATA
jgi:hypothetical protein